MHMAPPLISPALTARRLATPLFAGLPPDEVLRIAAAAHSKRLAAGEYYFLQGDPAERIYLLVEGRLKLDEWEKDGQKQSRLTVVAERVQFLSAPRRGEVGDAPPAGERRSKAAPAASSKHEDEAPPPAEDAGGEDLPF